MPQELNKHVSNCNINKKINDPYLDCVNVRFCIVLTLVNPVLVIFNFIQQFLLKQNKSSAVKFLLKANQRLQVISN